MVRNVASEAWYQCYVRRIENEQLPQGKTKREAYARVVGEDGFMLLEMLSKPEAQAAPYR